MTTISDLERELNDELFASYPDERCPAWCCGHHDSLAHLAAPEQHVYFDGRMTVAVGYGYGTDDPPRVRFTDPDGIDSWGTAADARRLAGRAGRCWRTGSTRSAD